MDGKNIVRRYSELETDRKIAEEVWDLLERFVYPIGGGKFFQPLANEGEMEWRRRNIYDDTAIMGADTLAASLHGSLTSPAVRWFDLGFTDFELDDDDDSRRWLDEAIRITWETLQTSNFNLEVSEAYLDLSSMGNAMVTQEPIDDLAWKGVEFSAMPLREAYFEEDKDGQPCAMYRRLMWRATKIADKFGKKGLPEVITKALDSATSQKFEIIYCIYKEDKNQDADVSGILSKEMRPYQSKYVLRSSGEQLGTTGGYYEMPAYFLRWRRSPGSQWGYGPGHIALATVLTLNELIKLVLESAEKVIDPVSLIQQRGLLSDLDLGPGGQVVVKDVDKSIKSYESRARFDVSSMEIQDLRNMIRRIFHVDQLELKDSPAMSATEVMVRYELMNRLLGPTMGRLQTDFLDRVVINTFRQLHRAGQFPEMPEKVKAAGGTLSVAYVGPLNRAQKSDEVASVERWLMDIANFAQLLPQLRHVPDPIEIADMLADGLNIPTKVKRDKDDVAKRIKEDEDAQKQATQNELGRQQMELDNLGQAGAPAGA